MKNKDFAVFILSNKRPDKVYTYGTLKRQGYTGRIYIVIDNKDDCVDDYKKIYQNEVIVFDKEKCSEKFDLGDNFNSYRGVIYARNEVFHIAKKLGVRYFIVLDDDYNAFYIKFDEHHNFINHKIKDLNNIFDIFIDFYKQVPNLKSIAFGQGGDYIGGGKSQNAYIMLKRKCMNSFLCSTDEDRRFQFVGRINEDTNTYVHFGSKGDLFFTNFHISLNQIQTQANAGGMTELYLDNGTYVKSFYSILYNPSSVKVAMMGTAHRRLHHLVNWECTVPKILSENYKKK